MLLASQDHESIKKVPHDVTRFINRDIYYQSTYNGSQVLTALNAVSGLALDKQNYQPKALNKKIKNILR